MELEAFKITVLPLRKKMLDYSLRWVAPADAEDIVQEAFLKLWSIREKLDAYRSVEALAIQVTKHLAIDKLRGRKHWVEESEGAHILSDSHTPEEQLEERDAVARVRRIIEALPGLQQTIIRMKDIEGYELAQIAEITGTQVEAVRSNLSRARKRVREQFLQMNK
ncbi:RNA polymerase sigma factor [Parabacteroides sp. Marseille-P3160]|uniref:RNA polymerase sigma factor n=1 Tax=Parabacteroides sp. Marseille-P3160 TaxID=1917887 RepID=UPI0009BB7419|nr:sigma-70 family RNA polymerase sigma factor [Parabacteroides sp. Marseille-P3160]